MLKLQIIQSDEEVHSLSQDMARLMCTDDAKDSIVECTCKEGERPIKAHSWIVKLRSSKLGSRLLPFDDERDKVRYIYEKSRMRL